MTNEPDNGQLILGKFKDQAALEQAYKNLESKLGQRAVDPLLEGHITPPGGGAAADGDVARSLKAQYAAKLNAIGSALAAGKPEAAAMLSEMGMDQNLAQFTTQGFQDGFRQFEKSMHEISGGPDGHRELMEFGLTSDKLSPIQKHAFRTAQNSGDPNVQMASLQSMKDLYRQHTGFTPNQLQVTVPGGARVRVAAFESAQEAGKACEDMRYGVDDAYTAEVQARMAVSNYEVFSKDIR